jgi:hypothetical protein
MSRIQKIHSGTHLTNFNFYAFSYDTIENEQGELPLYYSRFRLQNFELLQFISASAKLLYGSVLRNTMN